MLSSLIYFFAVLYPWWGLPIAFILFEAGNRNRRRGERKQFAIKAVISLFLVTLAVAYFVFNGIEQLGPNMQKWEKAWSTK